MAPVWLVLTAVLGLLVIFLIFSKRTSRQVRPPNISPSSYSPNLPIQR